MAQHLGTHSWGVQLSQGNQTITREPSGSTILRPSNASDLNAILIFTIPTPTTGNLAEAHVHFTTQNAFVNKVVVYYGHEMAWQSAENLGNTGTFSIDAHTGVARGNRGIGMAVYVQFEDPSSRFRLRSVGLSYT